MSSKKSAWMSHHICCGCHSYVSKCAEKLVWTGIGESRVPYFSESGTYLLSLHCIKATGFCIAQLLFYIHYLATLLVWVSSDNLIFNSFVSCDCSSKWYQFETQLPHMLASLDTEMWMVFYTQCHTTSCLWTWLCQLTSIRNMWRYAWIRMM